MQSVAAASDRITTSRAAVLPRIALLLCLLVSAGCLAVPDTAGTLGPSPGLTSTIYPWWLWVVLVGGVAAAVASLVWRSDARVQGCALAVTAIAAAQVAGSGVVAYKHWKPATGMGGTYGGRLDTVENLALVIGLVGLVAVVISVWLLVRNGDLPRRTSSTLRFVAIGSGLVIAIALPLGLSTQPDMADLTSWGAVSLIYAWPWGVALIAVAWASRATGLAASATVVASAALAVAGPQMTDLVFGRPEPFFAAALVLAAVVLVTRWTSRT